MIEDKKIEEIIELIESYMDFELDIPYCYGESDIDIYQFISDRDKELIKGKIREILNG